MLRSFELAALPCWEKGRPSQPLGRMQSRGLVLREPCQTDVRDVLTDRLTKAELGALAATGDKLRERLAALSSPTSSER